MTKRLETNPTQNPPDYSGQDVQCAECGAWGPGREAGDGLEPLCPGCSDPYGIVAGFPNAIRDTQYDGNT